jgi:hypothetical protein
MDTHNLSYYYISNCRSHGQNKENLRILGTNLQQIWNKFGILLQLLLDSSRTPTKYEYCENTFKVLLVGRFSHPVILRIRNNSGQVCRSLEWQKVVANGLHYWAWFMARNQQGRQQITHCGDYWAASVR